ncbi:methyl-accepting chemotaxis protein [Sphingomonas rubra]|uniref:Methyl-accepting chemotaxis protein n=1 Tax=Sphingomonas rubra TaxID=634430 RepID=A0A1I5V2I6_9SPHN|nr:methyl-accepting chemotaxis protein [Sphingomonas rubra]
MVTWFRAHAPIRRKFDILFVAYVTLTAIPAATTWLATSGRAPDGALLSIACGAWALVAVVALLSKRLICDP